MLMKPIHLLPVLIASTAALQAQEVLIGPGVRNGNFDDDASAIDGRTFAETPFWENLNGAQSANATRSNLANPATGSRNAQLTAAAAVAHAQSTAHTILAGETYAVSYSWINATNWNLATDRVRVTLFTTDDDTLTGAASTLASASSALGIAASAWQDEPAADLYTALPADAGKTLFVKIDLETNNDGSSFGRLDDFLLTSSFNGPLWELSESPDIVKMRDNGTATTTFSVHNGSAASALDISDPVFGDARFGLLSPALPVSIPPGGTQEFVVLLDFSATSGSQNISTTLTLTTNDSLEATRVVDLQGQILSDGQRVLIDYDDGLANGIHEASIRNGGFEDGVDGQNFIDTPFWIARFSPEGDTVTLTTSAAPATGGLHGVASGFGTPGERAQPSQRLSLEEWTLQEGDRITMEVTWKDGLDYLAGESMQMIIEVIDGDGNLLFDPVSRPTNSARMLEQAFQLDAQGVYQTDSATSIVVRPGSPWIGGRLLPRVIKTGSRASFIDVDNISLVGKLAPLGPLSITDVSFDSGTKNVTLRFTDNGAASFTVESDADLDFSTGVTSYLLDGSEDTTTYPGEIEYLFHDPTATGPAHFWRVRGE
jgi:hypothetical protein